MNPAYLGIGVTIALALLGGVGSVIVMLFARMRRMEGATADALVSIAQLQVKSEPGWASIMESAKLNALHKPEVKYERRDLLIKHRLAGSSTPTEDIELLGLFAGLIVDPESSPVDRINASAAIILIPASDEDRHARSAIKALPGLPVEVQQKPTGSDT